MSEISLAKNSAMASPKLAVARVRVRVLLTELNLHFAGVALLALLSIYLLVHLFFVWRQIQTNGPDALHEQELQMRAAEIAALPMRGLDGKIALATGQADQFSTRRLPFAVSQVAAELGALAKHEGARLARTQYVYAPVMAGTEHELTELRMDVSLSGDYRPLVHVINALERDKVFFLIESMTLTGQQTGTVNLRLRLTTYLRSPMQGEVSKAIVVDGPPMAEPMPTVVSPGRPVSAPESPWPMQSAPQQAPQQMTRPVPPQSPAPPPQQSAPRTAQPGRTPLAFPIRRNPSGQNQSAPSTQPEGTER